MIGYCRREGEGSVMMLLSRKPQSDKERCYKDAEEHERFTQLVKMLRSKKHNPKLGRVVGEIMG